MPKCVYWLELFLRWTMWPMDLLVFLVVYLGFYMPLENFSLNDIWRRHHYWWRASNLDLYIALMSIEQWEFLACHTYCDTGHPFTMVISEDLWHSHLFPSVWQWRCHYLFLWIRSVVAWILTDCATPTVIINVIFI